LIRADFAKALIKEASDEEELFSISVGRGF
jgi:hypothetical protein